MKTFLKQKKLFGTKEFELTDRSLRTRTIQRFGINAELEFKLEELTQDYFKIRRPNIVFVIVSFAMLLGVIITTCSHLFDTKGSDIEDIMLYLGLFIIAIFLLYASYENNLNMILADGRTLAFFNNLPSEEQLSNFLAKIKQTQKTYLMETYAKPNAYLSNEQMSNNLIWLRNRCIIDDDELNNLRLQLLPKPKIHSPVGFRTNNS